jgi:hypothetical protein
MVDRCTQLVSTSTIHPHGQENMRTVENVRTVAGGVAEEKDFITLVVFPQWETST